MTDKDKKYLQDQVQRIADEITAGRYLGDILNINQCYYNFIIESNGAYRSSKIRASYDDPNIWIDTATGTVEGHWGSLRASVHYVDTSLLDDYMCEMYEAMKRGNAK